MKVVFFGSGNYVLPVLKELVAQFELSLIITTEKDKNEPIIECAIKNNIPYLSASSFDENSKNEIKKYKTPLAIIASFGLIIPNELLDAFEHGIINIHPSLLPKYRGATPVQSAILNGDKVAGVSVMRIDNKMDHGPILARHEVKIEENETADKLYLRLFEIGAKLLSESVQSYVNGTLKLTIQDDKKATYIEPLNRDSGYFPLDNPPKKEILERMTRAYYPWPGVWTKIVINNKETRTKFLPENKLQIEGKKPINLQDFKNGYPEVYEEVAKLF